MSISEGRVVTTSEPLPNRHIIAARILDVQESMEGLQEELLKASGGDDQNPMMMAWDWVRVSQDAFHCGLASILARYPGFTDSD